MDLVCVDDLDEFASETDDEDELLAQDLHHRLLEDYGSNPDDEDRGVGLLSRLSGTDSPATIARMIEADFVKDDRVVTCEARVTRGEANQAGVLANVEVKITTDARALKLSWTANADGTIAGGIDP